MSPGVVAERLRSSGHRVTRQRLAVFEALAELGGHRGVDDIAARLDERGGALPLTSVYNSVDALVAAGVVSLAHRSPTKALDEVADHHHEHFVCRVCGAVLDLDPPARSRPTNAPPGALVEGVEVTYHGTCGPCASP